MASNPFNQLGTKENPFDSMKEENPFNNLAGANPFDNLPPLEEAQPQPLEPLVLEGQEAGLFQQVGEFLEPVGELAVDQFIGAHLSTDSLHLAN